MFIKTQYYVLPPHHDGHSPSYKKLIVLSFIKKVKVLAYKGYKGHVKFDNDTGIFHGEVLDLRDVVTFQGTSVDEIETAFKDFIDDYLEFCEERGEEPDKPFLVN